METEFCLHERYLWVWKKVSTDFGGRPRQSCRKNTHLVCKIVHDYTQTDSYFALNYAQKSLSLLLATSMRITSASETPYRSMQPQTKPPSPQVSKRRTLKVVFSLQLFCLSAAPPGSPPQSKSRAARLSGGHNRWSRTSKGITSSLWLHQTRTKPPACRPIAPPSMPFPAPAATPGCR